MSRNTNKPTHTELDNQVAEFLAKGGEITQLPGVGQGPYVKPVRNPSKSFQEYVSRSGIE